VVGVATTRTVFRCTDCGQVAPKWVGRCATCGAWSTLTEELDVAYAAGAPGVRALGDTPLPIDQVDSSEWGPVATGFAEVDRVLGGGLVPGSVTLVGGEPGIGKSTLLLQIVHAVAAQGQRALYVSAEESKQQVRLRAERLGALHPELWLVAETSLPDLVAHIDRVKPDVVVIDSVQSIADPAFESAPGTIVQVRECAHRLVGEAKSRGVAVVLVGHVTKEGALAGPRVLEHVVDTVLAFEGDRHHALRLLRTVKHRFGATNEIGVFEMAHRGLCTVADPSGVFLADRVSGVSGSVVVPTIEGHRPLLVELQALVTKSATALPRRSAEGVDSGRLALLLAVLDSRAGINVRENDVYALAIGGVQLREPGADLALCCAVASAVVGRALPSDLIVVGEVGLGGELRRVSQYERRLHEAARLGLLQAVVPASAPAAPPGMRVHRAATLREALDQLDLGPASGQAGGGVDP
jgi:DNA repair protein RadA/Sms